MKPVSRNPFKEIDRPQGQDHPIDLIAKERMPHDFAERIKVASGHLLQALGDQRKPWVELEALLNEYRQKREEVFFNIGYEHGHTAGESRALSMIHYYEPNTEYRLYVDHVREQVLLHQMPPMVRVATLLEVAWTLAFELVNTEEE